MRELHCRLNDLLEAYDDIKQIVRQMSPHLYERWKAGGFIVDEDVMSYYPNIINVVEQLEDEQIENEDTLLDERDEK